MLNYLHLSDLHFRTGDIAFSGQREEYELALTFCEKLLAITGVEKSHLYLVAGNHDLQQARELMQRTGCWRMKDWLAETKELLEYRA